MASVRLSLAINAFTQIGSLALTIAGMVVVSRLLTPAEIGLFSVSVSIIAFGHVFRDFGIGQYLVQAQEVDRDKLRSAFTVMLSISWFIALILFVARQPLSRFYGYPGVADVLEILALSFIILPFGAPHLSILRREMKFGLISFVTLSALAVQTATTISLAMMGASYMSMAWGAVAGNLATVLLLVGHRPRDALLMPKLSGIGEVLRFGTKSSTASLAGEIGSSAPDLILGRTLGFADVAIYSRACGLTTMVMNQLVNVVRGVYFPAFANSVRSGRDPASIYASTVTQLLGFIAPLLALMAFLASPLIAFLFGHQWDRAVPLATLICCYTLLTSPFSLADVSLVACGKVDVLMRSQLKIQTLRIAAILTSISFNLEAMVIVLGGAYVLEALIYMRALKGAVNLTPGILWRAIWKSYALIPASLAGPALVLAANHYAALGLHDFWLLAISGLTALAGWMVAIFLLRHPLLPEIHGLARRLRLAA